MNPAPTLESAPQVRPGSFLTLHYRLAGPDGGDIVNTFGGKPATISVGGGELAAPMEQRMLGLREGEHRSFDMAAGEAFGDRNPALVQRVAVSLLAQLGDPDQSYQEGDVIQFPTPEGASGRASFTGMVRAVGDGWLDVDFNHPLAGQAVTFEVHVIGVL